MNVNYRKATQRDKVGINAVTNLDAIMHNKSGSQPHKMAAWLTASHIERDPQRGPTPPIPPSPTAPKP